MTSIVEFFLSSKIIKILIKYYPVYLEGIWATLWISAVTVLLGTMLGNFQDGSVPGKIQFGSGWWFLDQKDGMEKQMNALSVLGLLSRFVGMLTDSRSFLSYPRHEYFRRTLCNLVGRDVENGEIPYSEMERVCQMIEDISYNNAKNFFKF